MKRHLFAAAVALIAMAGTARAQTPEATPVAAPTDPTSTPPATSTSTGGDPASAFGLLGQIVISGELQASIVHESVSMGGASSTNITVQPALDYFVMPNVSVGGAVVISHGSFAGGSGTVMEIGLLARAGYNLHLAPMVSLWPQLELGYLHDSISGGGGGASVSGYVVPLQIFAPFLFHVTTHLFVGIGPVFKTDLLSKFQSNDAPKTTDIGISSVVGGYFGP
jgi:hypothetical protein